MSIDEEVEVLRKIPLFANIDPPKLKLMCFASQRLTFKAGQTLFRQGDVGESAYIVIAGSADVMIDAEGGPLAIARLGKNDIIGEIAILCDVPRTATIAAAGELVVLEITKDLFFQMVTDFPEMGVEIMRVLAHRLNDTTAQLREARGRESA